MQNTNKSQQRLEALKAAGIDTTSMLAMQASAGNNASGDTSVTDPVEAAIAQQGTIPERRLFRRWVMAQMFRILSSSEIVAGTSIEDYLRKHKTLRYSWNMLLEELRVQAVLSRNDRENYAKRNRWFNKETLKGMVSDLVSPSTGQGSYYASQIKQAKTPAKLYDIAKDFYGRFRLEARKYTLSSSWIEAYLGAGAYFTMENLIRFHGCFLRNDNGLRMSQTDSLLILDSLARDNDGYAMFGIMRQMIDDNGIDIQAKRREWFQAKLAQYYQN